MKKTLLFALILILCLSFLGCSKPVEDKTPPLQAIENVENKNGEETAVVELVEEFGNRLQQVSLLGPKDTVAKSMRENYGDLVTHALLEKWQNDPQNAPGRMVSSPWPDRIEILAVEKISEDMFEVQGEIIEITSVEKTNGGVAAKRPVALVVKKAEDRWLIDAVTLGGYQEIEAIVYKNDKYGFIFSLPASWEDYSIIHEKWEGLGIGDSQQQAVVETGPMLSIRHPQWTAENQRQDIPILIFTLSQWNSLQKEKYHIGAAPIGPRELARNNSYVFALPARYNYAFPRGYEEVEGILESRALEAFEISNTD